MVVSVVYDNNKKATIHDDALWSCGLLNAKRAMLVFVINDGDDAAIMIKQNRIARANIRLVSAASLMPSTTNFLLASPTSDGAHRVHWPGTWDRLASGLDAEKEWGTLRTEGL